ncbi:MAG: cytochrome-c peroxidase, partial [Deltaproteobacteria bacterium]|nr:cytochrome-c peroxidase [Deltaproteobacteria bacterium]
MRIFGIKWSFLVAAIITLSFSIASAQSPDIGPLPERKAPNPKQVELGKALFFDARLSGDAAISCATCHNSEQGFTTRMSLSDAYP